MKTSPCTDHKQYAFNNAPRCNAKTKRNNGNPCRSPAVRGKNRCRMHGGARGSGAQVRNQNAFKHGRSTKNVKLLQKTIRETLQEAKQFSDHLVKIISN